MHNIELSCAAASEPKNHSDRSPTDSYEALGDNSNDLFYVGIFTESQSSPVATKANSSGTFLNP